MDSLSPGGGVNVARCATLTPPPGDRLWGWRCECLSAVLSPVFVTSVRSERIVDSVSSVTGRFKVFPPPGPHSHAVAGLGVYDGGV
ncbi:unnamed protein product [Gadus morhua 'NCC']